MKIFCDASNMHIGGGRTIILDFISAAEKFPKINFVIFIDERLKLKKNIKNNIEIIKVKIFLRLFISLYLRFKIVKSNCFISLGNIPPLLNLNCYSILFMGNRYIIDSISTKSFGLKTRLRINIERLLFFLFKNNVNEILVQSKSMQEILEKKTKKSQKNKIFAFFNNEYNYEKIAINSFYYDFIYVANDDPHKNHKNLLKSWFQLSKEKIYPSLCLVLPKNSFLIKKIESLKKIDPAIKINIESNLNKDEVISLIKSSKALIFPSFFESFGLPLIEAIKCKIDIIASEKDFVRDLVDPNETFDPKSPTSISRAIKRYLKIKETKTKIKNTPEFIDYVINSRLKF